MSVDSLRTTLSLPSDVIDAIDQVVSRGEARSRNEFVARALRHELALLERAAVDAAFAAMADDADYQAEATVITEEFSRADWEAFQLAEGNK